MTFDSESDVDEFENSAKAACSINVLQITHAVRDTERRLPSFITGISLVEKAYPCPRQDINQSPKTP